MPEYVVLDCEVYRNYFLATFVFESGEIIEFERFNDQDNMPLLPIGKRLLSGDYTLVTFNGKRYDIPIFSMALMNASNGLIKEASDRIIKQNSMWWELERKYNFQCLQVDHIDIINLLIGYASLKLYGARNGTHWLQDLPFDPAETISDSKAAELRYYCRNDCQLTWELFIERWDQIQLRVKLGEQYNQDLRSRSDAQIAEAVITSEYERITGSKLIKPIDKGDMPTHVVYNAPAYIKFKNPDLKKFLFLLQMETFELGNDGKARSPEWLLKRTVEVGGNKYAVGMGGLHAKNRHESYYSSPGKRLIEVDVASYYPRIMLNNGYEPPHMGAIFTQIYSGLVDQRLSAKASGDKVAADTLKITINGTFGKTSSPFSALYAPELLLGMTLTGQLALLMLIEMMAENGIQCVSGNTDSVTIMVEDGRYHTVVSEWQNITGFELEETEYKSIHYQSVNHYFALTVAGDLKTKGIFKSPDISKNPTTPIVAQAVMGHILYGEPVRRMIDNCGDVQKFLAVRTVKGGAAKDGEYLGKAIRWYYSTDTDTAIHYISNGNKVAKTDGAMPMMNLTKDLPDDLNIDWYVDEAMKTINEVGYESCM